MTNRIPDYIRYESLKDRFRHDNPNASPQQYQTAMLRFARLAGV